VRSDPYSRRSLHPPLQLGLEANCTWRADILVQSQSARYGRIVHGLFDPVVDDAQLNPRFREVRDGKGFAPARAALERIYSRVGDRDGGFRRQFQTDGFDARIWELYLFAAFEEQGWDIDQRDVAPDFILSDERLTWSVEATTANPGPRQDRRLAHDAHELQHFLEHELPIRLGSPLYSKVQRAYHELPQVQGRPFVLAIECFISEEGSFYSEATITTYLFGLRSVGERQPDGSLKIRFESVQEHRLGKKTIPSGFFEQSGAEFISAVMFSNSATISKFNRMAFQDGTGSEGILMTRIGTCAVHDPDAAEPASFSYDVAKRRETWTEGLVLIHNPRARHPLPANLLPGLAHYRLEDGQIVGTLPEFHAYSSRTLIVVAN
jgi:hypothetical protein